MKFEFTTDRTYDGAQTIAVDVVSVSDADDFGFVDAVAVFTDKSRHITGRANLILLPENFTALQLQHALMSAYDACQYEGV